jgi:maltooligosyltrehalose trehalohydrolase
MPDPGDPQTFVRCKLDHGQRHAHAEIYALHRDLLALRREDPVFRLQRRGAVDGAVLGPGAFLLRFFGDGGDEAWILPGQAALVLAPSKRMARAATGPKATKEQTES